MRDSKEDLAIPLKQKMANAIRFLAMDAVQKAKSGHPGMPMGMADVATVLFSDFLKFNPAHPKWADRDRFVLSAGHGSMLLYSLLYLTGYKDLSLQELKNFRQLGSRTAGHPEYGHAGGIETTTGPLGQGLANAVGMALGERMMAARYGDDLFDHFTYVIAGDGCLMEGISQEAISFAGHLKLNKLIVLFDDNEITIDGATDLSTSDDQIERFKASGWHVQSVDGHDMEEIKIAITEAKVSPFPSLIACRTTIGYGAPTKAGTSSSHGAPLGEEEIEATRASLKWPHEPFDVPKEILDQWRHIGRRGNAEYHSWNKKVGDLPQKKAHALQQELEGQLPDGWDVGAKALIETFAKERPTLATRQSSQKALEVLVPKIPELVGGSADLTGSNNTKVAGMTVVTKNNFKGNYVNYGVREHGMASIMNGLALHGGFIPYGGTFLVFADYARPAMRLSALMNLGVVYVMTHDSIGLGEDGPTHQPIEQIASLRAMPNLRVYRPADAIEVVECWMLAVQSRHTPSVLALSRQGVATLRESVSENLSARGAYIIREPKGKRKITLLATGSEVEIAVKAKEILEREKLPTTVVSMPCWEAFEGQTDAYKASILGPRESRFAIEAASTFGWEKFVESDQNIIGLTDFGASGKASDVYEHFGITPEAIVKRVLHKLSLNK